ncbi:hypothetical protein TNCV_588491 [Trichonephila clavipes]|nr:hypothetical protein TNCV_588491 [Trichonephila clavipes]
MEVEPQIEFEKKEGTTPPQERKERETCWNARKEKLYFALLRRQKIITKMLGEEKNMFVTKTRMILAANSETSDIRTPKPRKFKVLRKIEKLRSDGMQDISPPRTCKYLL